MASLYDVLDRLQDLALSAVTPNGPTTLFGHYVDVGQGWPMSNAVDVAIKAGRSLVSVTSLNGTGGNPGQIMNWSQQVIAYPVHGMTAEALQDGFRLTGCPAIGEYATVILDGRESYSYAAVQGDYADTVAAQLASQIGARARWTSAEVAVTGFSSLVVRIGAPAKLGEQVHRQTQQIKIITWAPSPAHRAAVATQLDVVFKQNLKLTLRDTSTAILTFGREDLDDQLINRGVYRSDIAWTVLWDTYAVHPAYEVTAVNLTIDAGEPVNFAQ